MSRLVFLVLLSAVGGMGRNSWEWLKVVPSWNNATGGAVSLAEDAPTASCSSHVLDIANGHPAVGVKVVAFFQTDNGWQKIGEQFTDANGRIPWVTRDFNFVKGVYKLVFATYEYYKSMGQESFYPEISVEYIVNDATQHYHVPITLSPYGYSTYRGA